jgi:hypothetical protein
MHPVLKLAALVLLASVVIAAKPSTPPCVEAELRRETIRAEYLALLAKYGDRYAIPKDEWAKMRALQPEPLCPPPNEEKPE